MKELFYKRVFCAVFDCWEGISIHAADASEPLVKIVMAGSGRCTSVFPGFFRCQAWGNDPKNVGTGGGTEVVEDGVLMTSSFGLHGFRFHILGLFGGVHKVIVC